MTGIFNVLWRIEPITSPQPLRHCSTCGVSRLFRSSGKVRLNANGQRLDAWLIYKCFSCERTWNLPLMERVAVGTIPAAELRAMQMSDPAWVERREGDLTRLGRYCERIDVSAEVVVTRCPDGDLPGDWSAIELAVQAVGPTGQRLDRLLAQELGIARGELQSMLRLGGLRVLSASDRALRKTVVGRVLLRFEAGQLTAGQRSVLEKSFASAGGEGDPG